MKPHAALLLVSVALAACHQPVDRPAPATPRRIVSLAASATEILFAIGAGDSIVGLDQFSDYPPRTQSIARVGSELTPSLERIIALRPDVVFMSSSANAHELSAELERLHVRVFGSRVDSLEELYRDIGAVGGTVGHEREAQALIASMKARISAVQARVAGRPRPRSLVVVWPEPLTVAGGKSFVHEALAAAGGDDIAADSPIPFPQYSVERLLARAPQVIVVGTHANGPVTASFAQYPSLPAVRDQRVYRLDGDLLFRPGPRLAEGIEALADLLHPRAKP